MTPRIYLDTSAYLGILLGEKIAKSVLKIISNKILCSSILLLLEAERNIVRLSRDGILTAMDFNTAMDRLKDDREIFLLKEVTMDICLTGNFPPIRTPKTSDLIHLRSAMWFHADGGLDSFLTLDISQRMAAQELGLPTVSL